MSLVIAGVFPGIPAIPKAPRRAAPLPPLVYPRGSGHPSQTTHQYRVANRLCTRCGDPCDRDDRKECSVCRSIGKLRTAKERR
jgi:hypothetical protein